MLIDIDFDNKGNQGLCNKLLYLSGLIRYSLKNKYINVLEPTFYTGSKHGECNSTGIKFSDIWDIDYFNEKMKQINFKLISKSEAEDSNLVVTKLDHNYANVWGWNIEHDDYINIAAKINKISIKDNILLILLTSLKLTSNNELIKDEIIKSMNNDFNTFQMRIEDDWKKHCKPYYINEVKLIKFYKNFDDSNKNVFISIADKYNIVEDLCKKYNINSYFYKEKLSSYDLKAAISFKVCLEADNFIGLTSSTFSSLITLQRELESNNNNNYYYDHTGIHKRLDKGIHYNKPDTIHKLSHGGIKVDTIENLKSYGSISYKEHLKKYNRYPAHKLILVAIFKNEAHILKEWIEHYIKQGVDKFYLINNGSTDNFYDILKEYNELIFLVNDDKKHSQKELYNKHFLEKRNEAEWILVCDLDEFIYARNGYTRIIDYLDSLDLSIGQIKIPWKMFGSNGFIDQPNLIIPNFIKRQNYLKEFKNNCKSIIRGIYCNYFNIHQHSGNKNCINSDGTINLNEFNFVTVSEEKLNNCYLHCNHYAIQAKNWFLKIKCERGAADTVINIRNEKYFNTYDYNETDDSELCSAPICCTPSYKSNI